MRTPNSSVHKQTARLHNKIISQRYEEQEFDIVVWAIMIWLRQYEGGLLSMAHQAKLLGWTMDLWLRQYDGALSFIMHQLKMLKWAMDLWMQMDNARYQVTTAVFTFILAIAIEQASFALYGLESGTTVESRKHKYLRRTSHMSAMAVDRRFLEETACMKQNVINVSAITYYPVSTDEFLKLTSCSYLECNTRRSYSHSKRCPPESTLLRLE